MTKRRIVLSFISLFAIPILLFQFQNCAPTSSSKNAGNDSGVKIVDDFSKSEIQFVQPQIDIRDEVPAAEVSGLCNSSHNGAHLKFAVWAGAKSDRPLISGLSDCASGQFNVDLQHLDLMVCGTSHLLVVEGDWGGSTFAHVTRRCQPLASQTIDAPAQSPYGTTCALEYSPASEAQDHCVQVCYRNNMVVLTQPLEPSQCSQLAAGLAGP